MAAVLKKVVVVACLLAIGCRVGAAEITWLTDFEKAKAAAAERKVPILVNFTGSDWCGWCIKLEDEVFSKPEFVEYAAANLVMFMADFPKRTKLAAAEKRQNEALARRYQVQGFPSILIVDAEGKVLGRTGYRPNGPEPYIAHLKTLLDASVAPKVENGK